MLTCRLALTLALLMAAVPAQAAPPQGPAPAPAKAGFAGWSDGERGEVKSLAADYMRFLANAKVPVQRTDAISMTARGRGFQVFNDKAAWKPGNRYMIINRNRAMLLVVAGKRPLREGVRMVATHLDSPRLELRIRPLRAVEDALLLSCAPYGGIKRYQWMNLPLALVGQVARADGRIVDVSMGEHPGDPVFILPDLAPHVDKEFRARTADAVLKGDELSPLVATGVGPPAIAKKVFMDELQRRYGLQEEDFVSAELAFVPAGQPREVGVDRSLVGGYGQDDGLCSYAAARAITELQGVPEYTSVAYMVDREEVGNINNTGARSRFLEASLERLLDREGKASAGALSSLFEHTEALSADVSQALNPLFPGTEDAQNTARVGHGLSLKSMKPGYDGSPTLRAKLRRILTKKKLPWQTYAYKVDGGGGGTIGSELQELNMDVVDVGAPLLAMHGTFELSNKSDIYALKRFFSAFYAE